MSFRQIDKEMAPGQVPVEIARIIHQTAADQRRSLSEVTTELICRGLGRDPSRYGIEATKKVVIRDREPAMAN